MQMIWEVAHAEEKGRFVIARRCIKKGSIIIRERAIACVPYLDHCENGRLSLRTGAYNLTQPEKSMLKAAGKAFKGRTIMLAARLILSILKKKIDINSIRQLCLHSEENVLKASNATAAAQVVKRLVDFSLMQDALHRLKYVSEDFCLEILARLESNAFTIVDDESEHLGIGIYLASSAINHDCNPSAAQTFNSYTGEITIRAIKDVAVGDEITISYIDTGKPVWYRKFELLKSYHFTCKCLRCCNEEGFKSRDGLVCGSCRGISVVKKTVSGNGCDIECPIELYHQWLLGFPSYKSDPDKLCSKDVLPNPSEPAKKSGVQEYVEDMMKCLEGVPFPLGDNILKQWPWLFIEEEEEASEITVKCSTTNFASRISSSIESSSSLCLICRTCGKTRLMTAHSAEIVLITELHHEARLRNQRRRDQSDQIAGATIGQRTALKDDSTPYLAASAWDEECKSLRRDIHRLLHIVNPTHYSVVELRSQLCSALMSKLQLKLQQTGLANEAVRMNARARYVGQLDASSSVPALAEYIEAARELLPGLVACYPALHVSVTQQQVQLARCILSICEFGPEAVKYVLSAKVVSAAPSTAPTTAPSTASSTVSSTAPASSTPSGGAKESPSESSPASTCLKVTFTRNETTSNAPRCSFSSPTRPAAGPEEAAQLDPRQQLLLLLREARELLEAALAALAVTHGESSALLLAANAMMDEIVAWHEHG